MRGGRSDKRDEILGDILRLDGAEAQLLELGFIQDAADEIGQAPRAATRSRP